MCNEKCKVQVSGHDELRKEKRKNLCSHFIVFALKKSWEIQKKPIKVVIYKRKGRGR